MNKIAVLIPCYNESKTIQKVVEDFKRELPDATIYVYDNCSTDNTAEIANKAGAIVRSEPQKGKGNVIRRMFREIDARCYIMADGDDTYPAEYAKEMTDQVLNRNIDMVVGDRLSSTYFTENKRRFHNGGNLVVRKAINLLFHSHIKDIMTGYRAFSYNFVKTFPVVSKGFEIETEMTIHAIDKNMALSNVIVDYRDRPEGSESKLNTMKDGIAVLMTIVKLWRNYKPAQFFGYISFSLMFLSTTVFVPSIMLPYMHTGIVEKFPLLIVCGFMAMASLLSFFTGMILQNLIEKEKREFEFRLQITGEKEKNIEGIK